MTEGDRWSLDQRRILIDCRWLEMGGAGRATELLLRGLSGLRPAGTWILWGGEPTEAYLWPGAAWIRTSVSPLSMGGQRTFRPPGADVSIHLHQIRPFGARRAITVMHDTIPLRHGGSRRARLAKRMYFKLSARLSRHIVTDSEHSKRCIREDLGVDEERISIIGFPVDPGLVERITAIRERSKVEDRILYVGRFGSHKNLDRLIEAFSGSAVRSEGGELWLVGGSPAEVTGLTSRLPAGRSGVVIKGGVSQAELESLYATSRVVVLPSLEEGFGLPVWEARSCGIPIAISDGGSLPEVGGPDVTPFSATSIDEMRDAIDTAASGGRQGPSPTEPTLAAFAQRYVDVVERVLAS